MRHSEDAYLQLHTFHQTIPSVIKQSMNVSFFDPSIFKQASKFKDFFLPPETQLNIGHYRKIKKEILFPKVYIYKDQWEFTSYDIVTYNHQFISTGKLLIFSNLYIDEHTGLATIKNPLLKKIHKLPQYTDDNISSHTSQLCLPLTVSLCIQHSS